MQRYSNKYFFAMPELHTANQAGKAVATANQVSLFTNIAEAVVFAVCTWFLYNAGLPWWLVATFGFIPVACVVSLHRRLKRMVVEFPYDSMYMTNDEINYVVNHRRSQTQTSYYAMALCIAFTMYLAS